MSSHKLATKTTRVLDDETATILMNVLIQKIKWDDGVRSKNGFTRKAKSVDMGGTLYETLMPQLAPSVVKLKPSWVKDYDILGMYINFYENGEMYTPMHSHPGQHQFVLSLGCERPLIIGKKSFVLKNGQGVLFGSSSHGVPKGNYDTPRISIALFMKPVTEDDDEGDENEEEPGIISLDEIKADPVLSAIAGFLQNQKNLRAVYEMAGGKN